MRMLDGSGAAAAHPPPPLHNPNIMMTDFGHVAAEALENLKALILARHFTTSYTDDLMCTVHRVRFDSAERDSASDSAVSSMGSERVPSLSDGEWCDAGSDSAQEYHR
ncbi:Segmentation protein cap'n'collar [Eumeta japonica]|uniref:Segmentation protein cap'n'collar n=1 Tax=Eumeta variegata TaxID=151549 RepID=A0A4C1UAN5_EUMVA|nr:Segmentation protein cap'n'collar [Eumeta japonica]